MAPLEGLIQLHGDCRSVLATLEPESVQAVVTSPPYFNLRDYGTAQWDGGSTECDHTKDRSVGVSSSTLEGGKATTNHQQEAAYRSTCGKCGATRIDQQIGLEAVPDCLAWARQEPPCASCYVCTMRTVFAGVWRALKADGVCWLNLGDSYTGGGGFSPDAPSNQNGGSKSSRQDSGSGAKPKGIRVVGIAPKNLLLIPARVALALQSDGWIVRSDIVWAKGNPMPESVKDRPTRSHETIYLLAKSERYYYDAAAVAEPAQEHSAAAASFKRSGNKRSEPVVPGNTATHRPDRPDVLYSGGTRNLRDVWQINPKPFSGAHFAVFPEAIPERCIRASTKPGDVVLDPFGGSGTTGRVAIRLQRKAILIELNSTYVDLQDERTNGIQIDLFAGNEGL